jgi:hypothetical protein
MQFTTSQTETMDAEDYAFYLAYGMTQKEESLDSLLNVEMYNIINGGSDSESIETSYGLAAIRTAPEAETSCV